MVAELLKTGRHWHPIPDGFLSFADATDPEDAIRKRKTKPLTFCSACF